MEPESNTNTFDKDRLDCVESRLNRLEDCLERLVEKQQKGTLKFKDVLSKLGTEQNKLTQCAQAIKSNVNRNSDKVQSLAVRMLLAEESIISATVKERDDIIELRHRHDDIVDSINCLTKTVSNITPDSESVTRNIRDLCLEAMFQRKEHLQLKKLVFCLIFLNVFLMAIFLFSIM